MDPSDALRVRSAGPVRCERGGRVDAAGDQDIETLKELTMGSCCRSDSWMLPVVAIAGVAVGAIGCRVASESNPPAPSAPTSYGQPEQPEEMSPEMQAWMEAGMPNEHHEELGRFVGSWKAEATFRHSPDAPAETSAGRQTCEMIYDGRYVRSIYEGEFGEMPFEGMSLMGYDNVQNKYVSIWVDSMSTMIYNDSGEFDESTNTFTMTSSFTDPTGAKVKGRHVMRFESADRLVMEMHESKDGGEWFQSGTIVFTRQ